MTVSATPAESPWTCPFCPLLCDGFTPRASAGRWHLEGSHCQRAEAALSRFAAPAATAQARIDGQAASTEDAVAAAAHLLAASRQPLFGGLGTDVNGARALYALACQTGAICDPAGGATLLHSLRALQDRGGYTTTLAEVRTRADLIVCIGGLPTERYPEFLRRCGIGEGGAAEVLVLEAHGAQDGDLFDTVATLAALVAGRITRPESDPLATLAHRLQAASYAVLVHDDAALPAQGSLLIEAIQRIVATLNQHTRAAALPLGGADGALTVNSVFTWLSGLPLRSRASPLGLEHEPLRFDAQRLLDRGEVDALLWIASFGTEPAPPTVLGVGLPRILLGHPVLGETLSSTGNVFIPVSTPGIGSSGHLMRTDRTVTMPLRAVQTDGLPSVASVLQQISQALRGASA